MIFIRFYQHINLYWIENAIHRMGVLIDDLLLYSHVSQRPHKMDSVDLNITIQQVLQDLELDIEEKGVRITVKDLPVVQGYQRQLQQLFQNLVSNALKYKKADELPIVEISADVVKKENKSYHVIKVRDNGIGFPQEYAEKIFEIVARLHAKLEYSGTGVGLSIVKKLLKTIGILLRQPASRIKLQPFLYISLLLKNIKYKLN